MSLHATPASPLAGLHIVEFEGLGPAPLAGWMLGQLGAQVTLISRPGGNVTAQALGGAAGNPLHHGKTPQEIDLKQPAGRAAALACVAGADALIEGFRPGVMERLGLGPADCQARRPQLVYGRMTGWGQTGPLAQAAGHDLNYVALSGVMAMSAHRAGGDGATDGCPIVPPTVLGDAGGALGLALGVVSGLLAVQRGGSGCVVDAAVVDVVAMLGNIARWLHGAGRLEGVAGRSPFHDSPFYEVYRCADGACITLGALEGPFYALLLQRLGLDDVDPAAQHDTAAWPALKARLRALFASQPRAWWSERLEGSDACFAPVLTMDEAAAHPHHRARGTFRVDDHGRLQAVLAPRLQPLG